MLASTVYEAYYVRAYCTYLIYSILWEIYEDFPTDDELIGGSKNSAVGCSGRSAITKFI